VDKPHHKKRASYFKIEQVIQLQENTVGATVIHYDKPYVEE
jgi:hypothetical protein